MTCTEKDLRNYLHPGITAFIGTMFYGLILLFSIFTGNTSAMPIGFLVFGGLAALCAIAPFRKISDANAAIDSARITGKADSLLQEFSSGEQFFRDNLRAGEHWLFGRKTGTILEYSNIRQVYQYVHKTNFAEDRRELRAKTIDNKTVTLCRLKVKGADDAELRQFLMKVLSYNPTIQLGYR